MSLHTIGLIFLLLGAGFFLNWGHSAASPNPTADTIMGAILAIIGFTLIMHRSPLVDATEKFVLAANQIMDDPTLLLSSGDAEERIKRIKTESRKATREIKERVRIRIQKITQSVGELTGSTVE